MKNIILLFTIVLCANLSAQDFDQQKLDSLFQLIESNQKAMGSISIFENGKETYHNAFGFASKEENLRANDRTKYRIGSISKTFTATIIMNLVEEGKLSLTTKLSGFYPEIKNAQIITVEQLLKHRSGIFNFTSAEDFTSWMEQPISKEGLVKKIVANGSVFEPNEKFEYSNSNYVLLLLTLTCKIHTMAPKYLPPIMKQSPTQNPAIGNWPQNPICPFPKVQVLLLLLQTT